jgi:uncharacterized protein
MALNLSASAADYVAQHHVMTLATQGGDGPWAAAVFYVRDGDDLIFLSSPSSRHCRDFAAQPRCAATIQSDVDEWRAIQGIQVEGSVSELQGEEKARAQQLYGERFPFVKPGSAPTDIVLALARVRWYRLRISRLYFIDNRRGLGKREQFDA